MKKLIAALLLFATTAHAGGIFTDSTTTPVAASTGTTTLWSKSISAGGVTADNALRIRMDSDSTGAWTTGTVIAKLNGVELFRAEHYNESTAVFDVEVWRTGNTTGTVVGSVVFNGDWCPLPATDVTGLLWTSGQTLLVTGISNTNGAVVMERAGYSK